MIDKEVFVVDEETNQFYLLKTMYKDIWLCIQNMCSINDIIGTVKMNDIVEMNERIEKVNKVIKELIEKNCCSCIGSDYIA